MVGRLTNFQLPFDFEDSGVPNSSSFRIGNYIIPGDQYRSPKVTGQSGNLHCTAKRNYTICVFFLGLSAPRRSVFLGPLLYEATKDS